MKSVLCFVILWLVATEYCFSHQSGDTINTPSAASSPLIEKIVIEGNTAFASEKILALMQSKSGDEFDSTLVEEDIDRILVWYENNGYPFAKISITHLSISPNNNITITLAIAEQQLVYVEQYTVEGNEETTPAVILRELRMSSGEVYNQQRITRAVHSLSRLNIFSSVSEPSLFINENGGSLVFSVQEGMPNTFDGVLGFIPSSNNSGGTVTGMVDISLRNLFGTARKASLHWQKEDIYSQEILLYYLEPWLFDFPINLSGNFSQRKQDTSYVRRVTGIKADYSLNDELSTSALFSFENTIPSINYTSIAKNTIATAGLEIKFDSRDEIVVPLEGGMYRAQVHWGTKSFRGTSTSSSFVQRLNSDVEQYFAVARKQIAAITLHARELKNSRLDISDLYRFGGTTSIRGYKENKFLGSRLVWSNLEYRFLLSRRSFAFAFVDGGYYYRPAITPFISSTEELLYGYGVGIRLQTAVGNIGVSFALGKNDTFSQLKLHLQLINDF